MSESEHRMIEILRILSVQDKPTGSKFIGFWMKKDIPKEWDIPEGKLQIWVVKN